MSKYVLKSSLPPDTQCPACICPKIKVNSGLGCPKNKQKECPPCPSVQRCNYEDCKKLVKCEDDTKPCPQDNKWCPACPKPSADDLKCPAPPPCPKSKAICPEVKCPEQDEQTKCEIINKNVIVNKDLVNIIKDLSKELENDPAAREKLLKARQMLKNIEIVDPEELQKQNEELKKYLKKMEKYIRGLRGRQVRPGKYFRYPGDRFPNDESEEEEEEEENEVNILPINDGNRPVNTPVTSKVPTATVVPTWLFQPQQLMVKLCQPIHQTVPLVQHLI